VSYMPHEEPLGPTGDAKWGEANLMFIALIKTAIFWDVTPCSLVGGRQRFRNLVYLHL
jgi:hypothetical protein